MSEENDVKMAIQRMTEESEKELVSNPQAALGRCRIAAVGGYTDCKANVTESACDREKGPGITAKWKRNPVDEELSCP